MSGITWDFSSLLNGLDSFMSRSEAAIAMYAETAALQLQNYARDKAPWTDRTGQARQRLMGTSSKVSNGYKLKLAHGVNYGIWLELAHEKRFAIIQPTILANSGDILSGFQGLLSRLG